jgi:hypothetical protein
MNKAKSVTSTSTKFVGAACLYSPRCRESLLKNTSVLLSASCSDAESPFSWHFEASSRPPLSPVASFSTSSPYPGSWITDPNRSGKAAWPRSSTEPRRRLPDLADLPKRFSWQCATPVRRRRRAHNETSGWLLLPGGGVGVARVRRRERGGSHRRYDRCANRSLLGLWRCCFPLLP